MSIAAVVIQDSSEPPPEDSGTEISFSFYDDSFRYTLDGTHIADTWARIPITDDMPFDKPFLFDDDENSRDLKRENPDNYQIGSATYAQAGKDIVTLPSTFSQWRAWGVDIIDRSIVRFDAGRGDDRVNGSGLKENILGDLGNDRIFGGGGNDLLEGGDGRDNLLGESGNDLLYGGAGHDSLFGGINNDTLLGDGSNDSLYGGDENDSMVGGFGDDALAGGDDDDTMFGDKDADSLFGGVSWDILDGGTGSDVVAGGEGVDTLIGGIGNDQLFAGEFIIAIDTTEKYGDHDLSGGIGEDFLYSWTGAVRGDRLSGGRDADHLMVNNADTIVGFERGDKTFMLNGGTTGLIQVRSNKFGTRIDFYDENINLMSQLKESLKNLPLAA